MDNGLLSDIIDAIGRGDANSIDAYLTTIEYATEIDETETKFYSHSIALNGNGDIRLDDFIEFIIRHIIQYVIPRSKILEARQKDQESGLDTHMVSLYREAEKLFTPLQKTGEGGEMLLFILGEVLLGLPQLLCKMSVKTAGGVHFHGADGVHVGVSDDNLELYWGESKFYNTFDGGIAACLNSISPILKREEGADLEDLLLLQNYLDLGNAEYTGAIKHILNKDNSGFNAVKYCGLCLIGFDDDIYSATTTKEAIATSVITWKTSISTRLKNKNLEDFKIHLFCLPVVSVEDFRKIFLQKMGLGNG